MNGEKNMKNKVKLSGVISLLLIAVMTFALTACSFNGGADATSYSNRIKTNVHDAVNLTRELRKQQENLDTRSVDSANKILDTLDKLNNIYSVLVKMDSPARYEDLNDEIKKQSRITLACVDGLRSLIRTSLDTGSDNMYKQDSGKLMDKYEKAFEELVDLSSQVTTRYRND